jgi:hypothetical protein
MLLSLEPTESDRCTNVLELTREIELLWDDVASPSHRTAKQRAVSNSVTDRTSIDPGSTASQHSANTIDGDVTPIAISPLLTNKRREVVLIDQAGTTSSPIG